MLYTQRQIHSVWPFDIKRCCRRLVSLSQRSLAPAPWGSEASHDIPSPSYLSTSLLASLSPCNFRAASAQVEARDDRATGCIYTSRHPACLAADHHPLPAPFSLLCRKLRASPAKGPVLIPFTSSSLGRPSFLFLLPSLSFLFWPIVLLTLYYTPATFPLHIPLCTRRLSQRECTCCCISTV